MVTENSTNSKFKVTFQGDSGSGGHWNGFAASKSMLRVERLDAQQLSVVTILAQPNPNKLVKYFTDPDGVLELPLRNILAANLSVTPPTMELDVAMTEVNGNAVDTFGKYIDVLPGLSWNDALAPRKKEADQLYWAKEHYVILPPNVILNPDRFAGAASPGIIVESNYKAIDANTAWTAGIGGVFSALTPGGKRTSELTIPYAADTLRITVSPDVKDWPLNKADDCTNLVVCRWTSQTGAVRQHFFPIVGFTKGTEATYSVVEAGNGYDVRKDWYDGIRCRLTGLTVYGYWYYMDILRASDLHAIVQPTFSSFTDEIASMETAAFCEAQEMETPQGNGFYNFEFTLKLRHYGQI